MLTTGLIGVAGACLLTQSAEAGLSVPWLYHGVGRPVLIEVRSPRSFGTVTLALLARDGTYLAEPAQVRPGQVDLREAIPAIWHLRRAAHLQLIVGEQPIGAPLVLQPMLSRQLPSTEDAVSPAGIRYTRIVGWRDEHAPPPEPPDEERPAGETAEPKPAGEMEDLTESDDIRLRYWAERDDPRLFTGLRIYVDRDVTLHTSHGDIRLAMRPDEAPNTVWNFLSLCEGGFYRGVAFHRIVPLTPAGEPFVIQAGDPGDTGQGGPGYWLPIEPSKLAHDFGVISMARDAAPDSAGSQFFICLSREGTARLDGHYCAFGYAVDGREAILQIAGVELADLVAGRPADPPVIESVDLLPAPPRWPGVGRPDHHVLREGREPGTPQPPPTRIPR